MSRSFSPAISPLVWLAAACTGMAQAADPASSAEHSNAKPPSSAAAAPAASTPASSHPLGYRSLFEGYRPFNEQPVVPWREANDLVGRLGGWQSYAREGQGGPVTAPVMPAASTPGPASAPVKKPPMAAAPEPQASGPHSGHHQP